MVDPGDEVSEGGRLGGLGWVGLRGDDTLTVDAAESEDELDVRGGGAGDAFESWEDLE